MATIKNDNDIALQAVTPRVSALNVYAYPIVFISRDAVVLPSTSAGVVTYTGSGCSIRVSINGLYLANATSGAGTFSVVATPTNVTVGATSFLQLQY